MTVKKIFFWSLAIIPLVAFAAVYYTSMAGDVGNAGLVNSHIRSVVNQSVAQWRPGDVVMVTSTTTGYRATYNYHPLYGKHFMTALTGGSGGEPVGHKTGGVAAGRECGDCHGR